MQGVFQQVHAVVGSVIATHAKFLPYLHVPTVSLSRIFVHRGRIGYRHVCAIEMAHVCGVYARGYPTLAEVEVKLIKSNLSRSCILQGFERVLRHFDIRLYTVISGEALYAVVLLIYPRLNVLGFFYHIAGDEAVCNLVILHKRIVIDVTFE